MQGKYKKIKFTYTQKVLEMITVVVLLGGILGLIIAWDQIPQEIPGHYNAAGQVDRWGDKIELAVLALVNAALYGIITACSFFPTTWNVPVSLQRATEETYKRTRTLVILVKLEMVIMFNAIIYYISKAQPLPGAFLPVVLTVLFGTIMIWIVRIVRTGRASNI